MEPQRSQHLWTFDKIIPARPRLKWNGSWSRLNVPALITNRRWQRMRQRYDVTGGPPWGPTVSRDGWVMWGCDEKSRNNANINSISTLWASLVLLFQVVLLVYLTTSNDQLFKRSRSKLLYLCVWLHWTMNCLNGPRARTKAVWTMKCLKGPWARGPFEQWMLKRSQFKLFHLCVGLKCLNGPWVARAVWTMNCLNGPWARGPFEQWIV